MTSSRGDGDVKQLFYKNKTIEQTIISKKRQTIEYKTQLTTKASIPEYIYRYISQQSILKQGFQKTHFLMILEVENFFAVDLANFYTLCKISDPYLNFNMVF